MGTNRSIRLRHWIQLIPLTALLVVGCIRDLTITPIDLRTQSPSFALPTDHPIIHVITVGSVTTDPKNYKNLWTVDSYLGSAVDTITYGELPPGFDVRKPPEELVPGVIYRLSVSGSGRSGDVDFEISPTTGPIG